MNSRPKIAVVGCGALGSFYGAKLAASGGNVHFLLRSDYETVRRDGVQIRSIHGDFHVHPVCARDPEEIGAADLVLIGLKTTANAEFTQLLPPLVGPGTSVLTLQNGLGNEEALAGMFGPERVLGGLCFVCLNRIAPGVIQHTAHGDIIVGEFGRAAQARTHQYADLFRAAGVRCQVTENLDRAHWQKLVWNIPFNGLGVAGVAGYEAVVSGTVPKRATLRPCLPTDQLLDDARWAGLVRSLMIEVVTVAARLGFELPSGIVDDQIARTRRMGAYKASTLIDFERGQPLELESLFLEPLRRARGAGMDVPRLTALSEVLSALDPARKSCCGGD